MSSQRPQRNDHFEVVDEQEEESTQSSGRDTQPLESKEPLNGFIATTFATLPVSCGCPPKVILEKECSCRDNLENETNTVKISIESFQNREYKPERMKTFLTIVCFAIVMCINHFVLAIISDIISRQVITYATFSSMQSPGLPVRTHHATWTCICAIIGATLTVAYASEYSESVSIFCHVSKKFDMSSACLAGFTKSVLPYLMTTPLPDLTHSLIKQYETPRHLSDIFASAAIILLFIIIIVLHKHRWIVTRRLFYIGTVLYIMRAVSICLTHIPASFSAETDICVFPNPDPFPSFESVYNKFLNIMVTMGLQVKADGHRIHCGDMLFSGHTTAISTSCFFLNYYTPHSMWPLKLVAITSCVFAMICMVVSRIHYSVDVVMGYWISSIIFSVYHGFCEVPHVLRPRNRPFRRLFLFWTMYELEHNVPEGRIPNELEWPLPWPQLFVDKFEEWNRKSKKSITGKIALWLTDHRIKLHF